MSAPLGYDINGRKLRAGDPVELVSKYRQRTTVRGPAPDYTNCEVALNIRTDNDFPWLVGNGSWLRKLTDDDRPATDAFTEWFVNRMDHVHRELNPAHERVESEGSAWAQQVLAGMPFNDTEGKPPRATAGGLRRWKQRLQS